MEQSVKTNAEDATKITRRTFDFNNFIKNNYGFLLITLFVFGLYAFSQAYFNIWPFGIKSKAIMASYDQLAQVCPTLEHYFSVLDGTSGLFHTFNLGGGMDMFGILAYCTVSPFSFLFLLGGRGNAIYMVSVVLPLKNICCAFSALWFLKRYFKAIPHYVATVMAILYSFGGYLYVANTYINWVDLMIYMPVLGAGFISFAKEGKIKLLSISLALTIYTCFSIASFSFLTVYPIGILYIWICTQKGKKLETAAKFSLCFALAVAISLPIMLPALSAYTRAGRNTGLFSRIFESDVKNVDHLYKKFSYVLCDSVFLFLTIVYFIRSRKDRKTLFFAAAIAVYLLPCLIDESMLLLNFGSYYSYSLRFGFIGTFLFFYIASYELNDLYGHFYESSENNNVRNKTLSGVLLVAVCLLVAGGAFGTYRLFDFILSGINDGAFEENQPFYSFFAGFAHSVGGLEGTAILLGIVFVVLITVFIFVKFKLVSFKDVIPIVLILAIAQPVFMGAAMIKGDRQGGSAEKYGYYEELLNGISKIDDDKYFRLKSYNYDGYISSDAPLVLRNYSHTLFNSMADSKNLTIPSFFGYGGNGTNSSRSNRGGNFSDALIGYKYIVYIKTTKSGESSDEDNAKRVYLTKTDVSANKFVVYKNENAFPLAAVIKPADMGFEDLVHAEIIKQFINVLSSGEFSLTKVEPNYLKNDDGSWKLSFKGSPYTEEWCYFDFPEEYEMAEISSGKEKALAEYKTYNYIEFSTTRSVTVKRTNGELTREDVEKYFHVVSLDNSTVKTISDKLWASGVKYELKKNEIKFPEKIIAEKGQMMYLGFTDIDGYTVKVNGKTAQLKKNALDLIFFDLDEGENEIEIKYTSPYYKFIVFGLIGGLLIVFAAWLAYKKFAFIFKGMQTVLGTLSYVLASGILLFFFIFPTILYIVKLIMSFIN